MWNLNQVEYKKILKLISHYCVSECGKQRILSSFPIADRSIIFRAFELLEEFRRLIEEGIISINTSVWDNSKLLKKAEIEGSYLEEDELLKIKENIINFLKYRNQLVNRFKENPRLAFLFRRVRVPVSVNERINSIIDEKGNFRDDASEKYKELTRRIRAIRFDVEQILQSYISSPEMRKYLQEYRITIKDDRYVIPLKHSYKGKIPGIVHTHSGTDQTLFVEPFSITDKNNEIKLLESEREVEKRRILRECTKEVAKKINELSLIQDTLTELDVLHAKLYFMREYSCTVPTFVEKRLLHVEAARHPLIGQRAVPVSFSLGPNARACVVTGPNTGGKTVLLKTLGVLVALAQSGFPVPARRFESAIFEQLFTDIGDEQSIEQSLSTFSSHIRTIIDIIRMASPHDLVLIDELGAGTDPIEGSALGTALLDYFLKNNIFTLVTTHLSMIKLYALENEGVEVASVQFDPVTLRPTYRVVMGIPGRSNALEIAHQLGLPEEVLEKTKMFLGEREKSFDAIFKRLGDLERDLSDRDDKLKKKLLDAEKLINDYEQRHSKLDEREKYVQYEIKRELSKLISESRKKIEQAIREVHKSGGEREKMKHAHETIEEVETRAESMLESVGKSSVGKVNKKEAMIRVGDRVKIRDAFGNVVRGMVNELGEKTATIRAGLLKVTVNRSEVVRDEDAAPEWDHGITYGVDTSAEPESICDIRGKRYEEGIEEVKRFLDNALLHNIPRVSIIHGLGTGALRAGVWEYLEKCPFVRQHYYARPEEGGYGCTVVEIKE